NTLFAQDIDTNLYDKIQTCSANSQVSVTNSENFTINPSDLVFNSEKLTIESQKLKITHTGFYIINLTVIPNDSTGTYRKLKIESDSGKVTSQINNDFSFIPGDKSISVTLSEICQEFATVDFIGNFDQISGNCNYKLEIIFYN
ncbi:MAG: hypothetical protein ABI554_14640, partial [Flavobacterium sp.]